MVAVVKFPKRYDATAHFLCILAEEEIHWHSLTGCLFDEPRRTCHMMNLGEFVTCLFEITGHMYAKCLSDAGNYSPT
jgi:hypothetical protein